MLTATQLAVGLLCAAPVAPDGAARQLSLVGTGLLVAGIVASLAHLGRPLRAWRAFLGLRTSWLSREIVAFAATATAAVVTAGAGPFVVGLDLVTAALGLAAVACSAMVYAATGRVLWRFSITGAQFFGATALLGAAGYATLVPSAVAAGIVVAVIAAKIGALVALGACLDGRRGLPIARTAWLVRGPLRGTTWLRIALGAIGAVLVATLPSAPPLAVGLLVAGEALERLLFFRAISPARMPGTL
jgi:DMSO reductase anchor subunit